LGFKHSQPLQKGGQLGGGGDTLELIGPQLEGHTHEQTQVSFPKLAKRKLYYGGRCEGGRWPLGIQGKVNWVNLQGKTVQGGTDPITGSWCTGESPQWGATGSEEPRAGSGRVMGGHLGKIGD